MSNPGPAVTNSAHPSNITTSQAQRLLGVVRGVNANAVASVALPINNSSVYLPQSLVVTNSNNAGTSANASSAALSIYTAPGGSGGSGSEVFASTTLANLTTNLGTQIVTAYESTTAFTNQTLYVYVGTASGNAGTVDVYVYGYDFSVSS
jgi:hypothetical protein